MKGGIPGSEFQSFRRRGLNQQSRRARDYQCNSPDLVEVEPGRTENRETQLAVDNPRHQSGGCKVSCGMNCGRHQCCKWTRCPGCVNVAGHPVRCLNRATAQQHWQQHQACAMCRRHQERPQSQVPEAHLHAHPTGMAMPQQRIDSRPQGI